MTDDMWKSAMEARIQKIETAIAVDKVIGANIDARLVKIEGTLTWLVRLVMGVIILGLVSAAFGAGLPV